MTPDEHGKDTFYKELERIRNYPSMPEHRISVRLARAWLSDLAFAPRKKRLIMTIYYCLKALFQNDKY